MERHTCMRIAPLLLMLGALAGCSSLPPYKEPAASADTALIVGRGSSFSLCGLSEDPICKVGVLRVDGQNAGASTSLRITPGVHELHLSCLVRLGIRLGDMQMNRREIVVDIAPGARYRVEAMWSDPVCQIFFLDAATGRDVQPVK